MSAWLALLKAGLPYVADIVADRLPVFTKRKEEVKNAAELTAEQIAELQQAVQHNAASIKALAEQLQKSLQAIEGGATENDRTMKEMKDRLAALEEQRDGVAEERDFLRQKIRSARMLALIAFGTAFFSLTIAVLSTLL